MSHQTISIIGCGWLGEPLAERLVAEGHRVKGSTTSPEKVDLLVRKGIDAHQLYLQPEAVGDLTVLLQTDTLIIDIPPKAGKMGDDFHPQQIRYLVDAIREASIKHVIYVSSTSIYPEVHSPDAQHIVVEDDVTTPEMSAAPGLVQAEQLVQSLALMHATDSPLITVVRCGGLLGYDRIPGKYVAGRTVDSGAVPVNYLHRDDAVGILRSIIQNQIPGVVNAVAPEHPVREAIYLKNCADFGYEQPTFIAPVAPIPYKIVSVEKLVQLTGYTFKYPDPLQFFYKL